MYYLCSPMLGVLLTLKIPLAAILFWLVFIVVTYLTKEKLSRVLKVGSFSVFFFLTIFIFAFFGWAMVYAIDEDLHNGEGLVVILVLPYIVISVIYSKVSSSYKKAIDILSENII